MLKTATYTMLDDTKQTVEYDPNFPCVHCGFPVITASVGGTAVCPWCDSGVPRPEVELLRNQVVLDEDARRALYANLMELYTE